jgi:glycosyltransferase involved in cell wall biosynthesis
MRVLFLSNFYPPANRGGYAQWCQEVAEGLRNQGHEVLVLTSDHGYVEKQIHDPPWIRRKLKLEMDMISLRNSLLFFTRRKSREKENLIRLQQILEEFMPNAVLIWGMWNLSLSLAALVEKLKPGLVAYYMGDYWPSLPNQFVFYWQAPARNWITGIPKLLLRPIALRILSGEERPVLHFEHVIFPTIFMRDELLRKGLSPKETKIILGAVDTNRYEYRKNESNAQYTESLSLLFVGRLTPEKGVHTAIEALSYLVHQRGYHQIKLIIVGGGEPDYEDYLHRLTRKEKVERVVTFISAQPKEVMPALYHQADIFLFTSIWPEPFGRVLIEAMASGLVVAGATPEAL